MSGSIKTYWTDLAFQKLCETLMYWSKHESIDDRKKYASRCLDCVIKYGSRYEDDCMRTTLFHHEQDYVISKWAIYNEGDIPSDEALASDNSEHIDYVAMCENETQQYKKDLAERRAARDAELMRIRHERDVAKQKEIDDMKSAMEEYMRSHDDFTKAQMARDLNIPYSRCLKYYADVKEHINQVTLN